MDDVSGPGTKVARDSGVVKAPSHTHTQAGLGSGGTVPCDHRLWPGCSQVFPVMVVVTLGKSWELHGARSLE